MLPDPPFEVYATYDPVRDTYYYDGAPFDCDGWRYNFLLEKYSRGEALTSHERNFMRMHKEKLVAAEAARDVPIKSKPRRGQLDLFSDLPDEDDAAGAQRQPTSEWPD